MWQTRRQELAGGSRRTGAISALAQQMAALELAQLLPACSHRRSAMYQIAARWGRSDPKAAAEYFLQNPTDDDGYNSPLQTVAQSWASSDPRELLEWAAPSGTKSKGIRSRARRSPDRRGLIR